MYAKKGKVIEIVYVIGRPKKKVEASFKPLHSVFLHPSGRNCQDASACRSMLQANIMQPTSKWWRISRLQREAITTMLNGEILRIGSK
jgi:hypothetical protein